MAKETQGEQLKNENLFETVGSLMEAVVEPQECGFRHWWIHFKGQWVGNAMSTDGGASVEKDRVLLERIGARNKNERYFRQPDHYTGSCEDGAPTDRPGDRDG